MEIERRRRRQQKTEIYHCQDIRERRDRDRICISRIQRLRISIYLKNGVVNITSKTHLYHKDSGHDRHPLDPGGLFHLHR